MDGFSKVLKDIAENTQPNRADIDFIGDNGLLYCGKCKTPKQVEVSICGKVMRPYCMCKCEAEAYKAEQSRLKSIKANEEIERNRASGFLDLDVTKYKFKFDDNRNPVESDRARRYVDNFDKMKELKTGLMFLGGTGTGKSFLAACIASELIDKGYKCLMTNFPRIINEVSGLYEGKQAYIDGLNRYELLVIDDMAIERDTEYVAEIVHNIIDSRYRAGLPLIITTNLTVEEFAHPKDVRKARIYSRLKEMCVPIPLIGRDRRNENAALKNQEVRNILGI
jgi:DNA replication protein DnaC